MTQVSDVIEKLKDHFTLPASGLKMLVFEGKILQNVNVFRHLHFSLLRFHPNRAGQGEKNKLPAPTRD